MTDSNPREFATELLLPFTFDCIRNEEDPWTKAHASDPEKYALSKEMEFFEKELDLSFPNIGFQ